MSKSPLTIELVGGLGNQLFGVFAGLAAADISSRKVFFETSEIPNGLSNHNVSVNSFEFPLRVDFVNNPKGRIQKLHYRFISSVVRRSVLIEKLQATFGKNYISTEIGFDKELMRADLKAKYLRGYFQSWKYFEHLRKTGLPTSVSLKSPSLWYLDLAQKAMHVAPVMVHVRRGDYSQVSDSFGLLSTGYYKNALDLLAGKAKIENVWVISDQIEEAKILLEHYLGDQAFEVEWISPPDGTDPAESLMLMSHADSLVIANSTFSWWGARLGDARREIVAPSPWFKGMAEPRDLIPAEWSRVQAEWVS